MVLAQISVELPVHGDGAADRGREEPSGLVAGEPAHDAEYYLAGGELLKPDGLGDYLCRGREYAGDLHKVELLNAGVTEGKLEWGEGFFVVGHAPCQKASF